MNDKWLNDIRERMHSYETDAPEGLWKSLEREMSEQDVFPKKRHASAFGLWSKRVACAAAAIGVVAMVSKWLFVDDSSLEKQLSHTIAQCESGAHGLPSKTVALSSGEENRKTDKQNQATSADVRLMNTQRASIPNAKEENALPIIENAEEGQTYVPVPASEETDTTTRIYSPSHNRNVADHSSKDKRPAYVTDAPKQSYKKPTSNEERLFAFSVFSSGGLGSNLRNASNDGGNYMVMAPGSSAAEDSLVFDIVAGNETKNVETQIHHRQPVRFGLTFSYALSERVALETGLTYTRLSADMREGSTSFYYTGEQTLHYVGVPLNVKYQLLQKRGFSIYGTAGVLTEKRVHGKLQKNYVIDAESHRQEKETISSKPWQFSTNAALGVQYKFVKCAAVYAEPGVSYYFNDGSNVKTIYKQKPFNFNFNLGLRFILDK